MICIANLKLKIETKEEVDVLMQEYKGQKITTKSKVVVCPSNVFLDLTLEELPEGWILGAQDVSRETKGSHTGETSAVQLASIGCKYGIVGHSEKRKKGETFKIVSQKAMRLLESGIIPVVCFGESAEEREGDYLQIIKKQISEVVSLLAEKEKEIIFAYEPIWAIGKEATRTSSPSECHEVLVFARSLLEKHGLTKVQMVYGGSVSPENSESFVRSGGVDGFLVGRAGLSGESFAGIIKTLN